LPETSEKHSEKRNLRSKLKFFPTTAGRTFNQPPRTICTSFEEPESTANT
jgi:hypothetical protein